MVMKVFPAEGTMTETSGKNKVSRHISGTGQACETTDRQIVPPGSPKNLGAYRSRHDRLKRPVFIQMNDTRPTAGHRYRCRPQITGGRTKRRPDNDITLALGRPPPAAAARTHGRPASAAAPLTLLYSRT
ncbi:hypothetical protein EVAR_70768_1 [Eumeta japonica]|uniref:Uncharacterized protein n=1 Tax=Eumeta variegata TaxID=151549 RepID=A0A4C2A4A3_EUMVA|nr:hypothetical protein EVAR_70768_1 [Eumeta japonica]